MFVELNKMCFHVKKTTKVIPLDALDKCPICLDPMYKDVHTFSCKHSVHIKCGFQWLVRNRTCPICRKYVEDSNILRAIVTYLN